MVLCIAVSADPEGGNHTPAFTKASQTEQAHHATLVCAKSLALTGLRLLDDPDFFEEVGTFCLFYLANESPMNFRRLEPVLKG